MPFSTAEEVAGRDVYGSDEEKIGSVDEVYLDTTTHAPEWVSVKTGWFGSNVSLIPISAAVERGRDLYVPFSKDQVSKAPNQDPGHELSEADEQELYHYYGVGGAPDQDAVEAPDQQSSIEGQWEKGTGVREELPTQGERPAVGQATGADDAITRSEEQLHVGKEKVETGRVRLRKYVVTENVQTTVPVTREEVRLEREPITDENVDAATAGTEISEAEHEVVLHEERPVVSKEVRPVERVRLGTEAHTEDREVADEVRKERIEVEDNRADGDIANRDQ